MLQPQRVQRDPGGFCSQEARLCRRLALADAPTRRVSAPRETAPAGEAAGCRTAELLAQQNRLLCDILGAVNSLTAACMALHQSK